MSELVEILLSNTLYMIITVCISVAVIYFAAKKMTKLLLVALIALIVFLSYVYYTGESVGDTVDRAGEVIR
jgi:uncharacterized protein YqhQ